MIMKSIIFGASIRTVLLLMVLVAIIDPALSHPIKTDDLLRPKIDVISLNPMVIRAIFRPRENLSAATVETPNNLSGRLMQCEFGMLVANQTYECRLQGSALTSEPVFTVRFVGVLQMHGRQHFSSRSLSIDNPDFDRQKFSRERKELAERGLRLGLKTEVELGKPRIN